MYLLYKHKTSQCEHVTCPAVVKQKLTVITLLYVFSSCSNPFICALMLYTQTHRHTHMHMRTHDDQYLCLYLLLHCQGPPGRPGLPGADGIRGPPGTVLMFPVRPQSTRLFCSNTLYTQGREYWHDHKGGLYDRTSFTLGESCSVCWFLSFIPSSSSIEVIPRRDLWCHPSRLRHRLSCNRLRYTLYYSLLCVRIFMCAE